MEVFVRYLLGELPTSDRDRFEDEYFAHDDLHEQLLAIECELIDAYVRGDLSPSERGHFEGRYLATSEGRERVARARALDAYQVRDSILSVPQPHLVRFPREQIEIGPSRAALFSSQLDDTPEKAPLPANVRQLGRSRSWWNAAMGLKTALAAGVLIVLFAANIYLYVQLDQVRTDLSATRETLTAELASLRDASSVSTASATGQIEMLQQDPANSRLQAWTFSSQALAVGTARAEQLVRQLAAEQARAQLQFNTEIKGAKQAADTAAQTLNSKIANVSTDVGSVKTQLFSTQSELEKTIAALKYVQGDLGVTSGLVATNGQELAALKLKGERNYIDVKLGRTKQPVRFADITLMLRKADPKHNQFTVDVMADDKLVEKKDREINEPIQFYTAKGGRTPYELVINFIGSDQIVGYLSIPKNTAAR
jgi:anti-sigma factor RsiW